MKKYIFYTVSICVLFLSCHPAEKPEPEETTVAVTPVSIDSVKYGPISDSLELNASSTYLQNSYVKSIAAGYIKSVQIKPGDFVNNGKTLFTLETKESAAIGETISNLDSSFKFSGLITIQAKGHGYITQLNHQPGDYVQDGEQLAVISDQNSFVFLLDLPYELRAYVTDKKTVQLILPDGETLNGTITSSMPTVDAASQTQSLVIKVNP